MMLPEHVKLLREYYNEDQYKVKKPCLDEQKYEEFNEMIYKARVEKLTLQVTCYQKGELKKLIGTVQDIDSLKRQLDIISQTYENCTLKLDDIIEIEYF